MCLHHNTGQRSWANMHTEHQEMNQAVLLLQSNVFCNKSNNTELWVSTSRGAKKCLKKAKSDFSILRSQSSSFFWFSIHTYLFFFLPFLLSGFLDVTSIHPCGAVLFLPAKFVRKAKLKTKNSKRKWICRFSVGRSEREKNVKIRHLRIFVFSE